MYAQHASMCLTRKENEIMRQREIYLEREKEGGGRQCSFVLFATSLRKHTVMCAAIPEGPSQLIKDDRKGLIKIARG